MDDEEKSNTDDVLMSQETSSDVSPELRDLLKLESKCNIPTFEALIVELEHLQRAKKEDLKPEQERLLKMSPAIWDLATMVGQDQLKEDLLDLILFAAQNLHQKGASFLNVCLFAPPGTGKTKLTQILADLFYYSGFLPRTEHNGKQRYLVGNRTNMIGGYAGQTAILTQRLINRCINEGKVLLVDEAYGLGSNDMKNDLYGTECFDTLNQNLSDHCDTFRCVIAGYEEDSRKRFFTANKGLARRFGFLYRLQEYTPLELREMFFFQLTQQGYDVDNVWRTATSQWFTEQKQHFCYAGGDIVALALLARIQASRRSWGLPVILKPWITQGDLTRAMFVLQKNRKLTMPIPPPVSTDQIGAQKDTELSWKRMYI